MGLSAQAGDSVVFGRAVSNTYIEGVDDACGPLSANEICMNVWFVWTISVSRTVAGPPVTGRVHASRPQHTKFLRSYMRQYHLFVLRPIEDPEQRELLQADYHLMDMSDDNCLDTRPREISDEDVRATHTDERGDIYCFAPDHERR